MHIGSFRLQLITILLPLLLPWLIGCSMEIPGHCHTELPWKSELWLRLCTFLDLSGALRIQQWHWDQKSFASLLVPTHKRSQKCKRLVGLSHCESSAFFQFEIYLASQSLLQWVFSTFWNACTHKILVQKTPRSKMKLCMATCAVFS